MLVQSAFYYEGTEGGKLGWTPEAEHTLVTLVKRGDLELICVVMKSRQQYDKYKDSAKLLDAAFQNYAFASIDAALFSHAPVDVYDGERPSHR
jgi:D-alanyl-D-alanine carboxypeptidase